MANGLREEVRDPLALSVQGSQAQDRSLGTVGVRAPASDGNTSAMAQSHARIQQSLGVLGDILGSEISDAKDDAVAEGKQMYVAGATEQELAKKGDLYTSMGYNTLKARNDANIWFTSQVQGIDAGESATDPTAYQAKLTQARKSYMEGITDPFSKKVASAALEGFTPRLVEAQMKANTAYAHGQTVDSFTNNLISIAGSSGSTPRVVPGGTLSVSPSVVSRPVSSSDQDRDQGIRTILGEAGGEGDVGMAAVAHVIKNRVEDGGYGGHTVTGVVRQPKQFSTWNLGPGGNNPGRYKPGTPAYEKAGAIYDAVMAGHVTDMTGGATHYYSPAGMKTLVAGGSQSNLVPSWAKAQEAKSGGSIRIGGHVFSGRAGNRSAVDKAGDVGGDLTESGATDSAASRRSPPATAASDASTVATGHPAPGGQVVDEEQTKALRANGVLAKDGYAYKTDAAPAVDNGDPAKSNPQPAPTGTEVADFAAGFKGLKPEDKAAAIANAVTSSLAQNNPQVWNALGGAGGLAKLGLNVDQIQASQKAYDAYDEHTMKEFNVDREKQRADLIVRARNGEDPDKLINEAAEMRKKGLLNDGAATSLVREIGSQAAQSDKKYKPLMEPDVQRAVITATRAIQQSMLDDDPSNDVSAEQAANGILQQYGEKYGFKKEDIEGLVADTLKTEQSSWEKQQNDIKTEAERAKVEKGVRDNADLAVSTGKGLAHVDGQVTVINNLGNKQKVSAQQYGIEKIKQDAMKVYKPLVDQYQQTQGAAGMSPEQASQELLRNVNRELSKQGVVDQVAHDEYNGSLRGAIVDPKTHEVNPQAMAAFEAYLTLKGDDSIPRDYLNKLFDDPNTNALVQTASYLRDGSLSVGDALVKADAMLTNKETDPLRKVTRDVVFNSTVAKKTSDKVESQLSPSLITSYFSNMNATDYPFLAKNLDAAKRFVADYADSAYMNNPNIETDVAVDMGADKLMSNMDQVSGNLIVTHTGKPLGQELGLQEPGALDAAMDQYIAKNGAGFEGWKEQFNDAVLTARGIPHATLFGKEFNLDVGGALSNATAGISDAGLKKGPAYQATYNPIAKVMIVDMYTDAERTKTAGHPVMIPMDQVVKDYQKEKYSKPGTLQEFFSGTLPRGAARASKILNTPVF